MFEKEIAAAELTIQKNTIGNSDSIALKHLLESNIPYNVKSFFKAEVEWLLYNERKKEQRSTHFNYLQEDIRLLQEQMDTLLIFHYSFDKKAFSDSLDRCIHFLFNFLCRPQWTLENFLFEESDSIAVDDLKRKFRFCSDYRYYWSVLEPYCTSKNIAEINKTDFTHLLKKIDREVIKTQSAVELARMTAPLYQFIHYIRETGEDIVEEQLPTKALVYFFEDKHITSVAQHLLKMRDFGKAQVTYNELIQELKDSFVTKGFSIEEEVSILTPAAEGPALPLHEHEKKQIVTILFGGQESRFRSIVGNILTSSSWDDAALALDHYFTMNDIDPFSREAITFTNSLQNYFSTQQSKDEIN
ncbi:MAG: hypothetical protein WCT99_06980 [Bacteroidota bacterium]|jgi:hypothetical protein